jgi:hypothetical protein
VKNASDPRFGIGLSWRGAGLAPLVAPLIFSIAISGSPPHQNWLSGFLFFFILGSAFSYGMVASMFMPALFVLSRYVTLRFSNVCALGTGLGAFLFLPVAWVMYKSSGPDSGPPEGTYFEFLSRSWGDFTTWFFPIAGLVTAFAYCLIAFGLFRRKPAGAVATAT